MPLALGLFTILGEMSDLSEPNRIPPAALALGLAGLVPFAVSALLQWTERAIINPDWALSAGLIYGAVILSFLGGIRWGTAIGPYGAVRQGREFALSMVPPLAGWVALLLPPTPAICLLAAGFFMQALWDVMAVERGRLPPWFGRLRLILTAGAVAALMAMLAKLAVG